MMTKKDSFETIPENWTWHKLHEISTIVLGQSPPSDTYNSNKDGLPFYQGKSEFGDLFPTTRKWCTSPKKIAEAGDILISVRAPVGPTNICQEKSCIGRGLAAIRSSNNIPNKYILYYFRNIEKDLASKATGTTFSAITGDTLRNVLVPLAPPNHQIQIVSKIEELFTQLDATEAALLRAKNNLKRYKQSLLQAAVTGELTKDWREAHKDELEPASKLLEKIKTERKAKWEAEIRAKGKDPAKEKYKESKSPDVSKLPALPDGWCWVTLSNLTYQIADVDHKMPKAIENGIPYVSTKDFVSNGEIDFENSKKISNKDFQHLSRKIKPEKNDILLSRYGTVGEVRLVKTDIQFQASYSIAILKTIYEQSLINYSIFVLQSKTIQDQIRFFIRGVAQPDLGLTHIREICFPLPPLDEQKEILSILEQIEVITEKTNSIIIENIRRTESLRKSILHNAFTGQLIQPQTEDLE